MTFRVPRFLSVLAIVICSSASRAQGTVPLTKMPIRETAKILQDLLSKSGKKSCADLDVVVVFCTWSLNADEAKKAGQLFWGQEDSLGFSVAKMVNIQGLGDSKGESTYLEMIADLWSSTRISLGGVFRASDTTTTKSKAQQFLNGGGPAVVTLLRPLVVSNIANSRSVVLLRGQASFSLPGQGSSARDSLKYADLGADLQTSVAGASRKIGGLFTFHAGRIIGGRDFYKAYGEDDQFWLMNASIGLVVEQAVSVTWSRVFRGPNALRDVRDLIGVKLTR